MQDKARRERQDCEGGSTTGGATWWSGTSASFVGAGKLYLTNTAASWPGSCRWAWAGRRRRPWRSLAQCPSPHAAAAGLKQAFDVEPNTVTCRYLRLKQMRCAQQAVQVRLNNASTSDQHPVAFVSKDG